MGLRRLFHIVERWRTPYINQIINQLINQLFNKTLFTLKSLTEKQYLIAAELRARKIHTKPRKTKQQINQISNKQTKTT